MSAKNEKVPARDLIWTMLFCFILGMMPILFSLLVFLFYWDDMQVRGGGFVSVSLFEKYLALIRILIFGLLPMMGFAFFCVGYMVWKCYRISKLVNNIKNNSPDNAFRFP